MEKAMYVNWPFQWLFVGFIFLFFSLIILCFGEIWGAMISFIFALSILVLHIIFRKKIFAKILINEVGIEVLYREKLICKLKWEDIKDAVAVPTIQNGQIIFSDNKINAGKDQNKTCNSIIIPMDAKFTAELFKYLNKIQVEIRDLEKLPIQIQEKIFLAQKHNY